MKVPTAQRPGPSSCCGLSLRPVRAGQRQRAHRPAPGGVLERLRPRPRPQPLPQRQGRRRSEDARRSDAQWADITRRIVAAASPPKATRKRADGWRSGTPTTTSTSPPPRTPGRPPPPPRPRHPSRRARSPQVRGRPRPPPTRRRHRRQTPHEQRDFKARRQGQDTTAREILRMRMRRAGAAASSKAEFFALLEATGVSVRPKTGLVRRRPRLQRRPARRPQQARRAGVVLWLHPWRQPLPAQDPPTPRRHRPRTGRRPADRPLAPGHRRHRTHPRPPHPQRRPHRPWPARPRK